ncbi:hypothetical protein COEREDRAFT_82892 [Coemansia reversa NRRL 1564]|uniref:Uncharacterized protein n=1 Tax=Coemansia reversa (strain ATCC 12441 / NRRL 1564) TaxID=763665 RepID=A0A2G5B5D7_COERN|nr:hypothetical protein COEREDRAFT_82892 [Coemansia reversa NRRL 1564]|eukprot:PIA14219.1 hypothetical protein COEREDRAFT_82892 [Coemansia reversa NRRL 1564]
MASIRISTASLAALGSPNVRSDGLFGLHKHSSSFSDSISVGAEASSASRQSLAVPNPRDKLTRRVSFNLNENSVLRLPSNTAISKISQARNKRHNNVASSIEEGNGLDLIDVNRRADRQAQALLPHGASPELLDSNCAMTALYVKRGHICIMDNSRTGDNTESDENYETASEATTAFPRPPPMPTKGVLKPYDPSPVNTEFLIHGLPEEMLEDSDAEHLQQDEGTLPGDNDHVAVSLRADPDCFTSRRSRKSGAKKKGRGRTNANSKGKQRQQHADCGSSSQTHNAIMLPSSMPLPILTRQL